MIEATPMSQRASCESEKRTGLPLGLACVALLPALFWSTLGCLMSHLAGFDFNFGLAVVVFVAVAVFLATISTLLCVNT